MTLFDNGSATALGTATVGSDGTWSTGVTLSGNGSHSIVAKDTDAAGNTGTSSAVVYTLTVTPNGWADPNGGNWNVAANWSSGAVPRIRQTFRSTRLARPLTLSRSRQARRYQPIRLPWTIRMLPCSTRVC